MTKTIDLKRIAVLLGLVMATLVVLSALSAPDAQAKKKHHKRPPAINVVQCPTESNGETCLGTGSRDRLVGRDDAFDDIKGGEGSDVYDGKGGGDDLFDSSTTSNDTYLIPATDFGLGNHGGINIDDEGGSLDVLDLSAYKSTDFALSKFDPTGQDDLLIMQGPGQRGIGINFFFTRNTIDRFKFSDGTFTAEQIKSKVP